MNPLIVPPDYGDPRLPQRFWDRVYPCPITGCWLWGGYIVPAGYARFCLTKTKTRIGHRHAWIELVGPVEDGKEPDHLCRTRPCVNPAHLEPVTHLVNVRRGRAGQPQRSREMCPADHEYSGSNLIVLPGNRRGCRECRIQAKRRYRTRLRAAS